MTNNQIVKAQEGLVEVFNFSQEKTPIRVKMVNNEPWFVAKDVCEVLEIANHKDATSRLENDERNGVGITDPMGRKQVVTAVSESGLYSLIFQSRKPKAKSFRRWVTGEVLPSIRKKGFYGIRKAKNDYVDARDIPYERMEYNGCSIRTIEIDGVRWYSINDVNSSIGSRTDSAQSVKRLNAKRDMAQKILLYGVTQPGWFTTLLGVRLLLCGSQKHKTECKQLMLDFKGEED